MTNIKKKKGILDANLMIGYIWADTKRATAAAVITCTDRNRGAKICDQLAMSYWGKRNNLDFAFDSLYQRIQDGGRIVSVKGNPNLGNIKTIMLGVRNPLESSAGNGQNQSAEIWINEFHS